MTELDCFFFFLKYLYSDVRNFLSYIKENHGGIFRKLAFSSMLESYIKLNQEVNTKNLKLRELDHRLAELEKYRSIMATLKDLQQPAPLASSRLHSHMPSFKRETAAPVSSDAQSEDTVSETKTLKISANLELNQNKAHTFI
jgi:hypothetical protein